MEEGPYQSADSGVPVGERITVSNSPTGETLPPGLRTPEEREATVGRLLQEAEARGSKTIDFAPITGKSTNIVYLMNNRFNGVMVSELDLFIPGRMDPSNKEGPFLVIEREQLERAPSLNRLLRMPIIPRHRQDPDDPSHQRKVLEEISEERYLEEHSKWVDISNEIEQKQAEKAMAATGDEDETGDIKINRQILRSTGVSAV